MKKEDSANNNFGLASVIFSILSIFSAPGVFLIFFYGPFMGILLGITAFIFALVQRKISANRWSTAGLVLSLIGIVLNFIVIIWLVIAIIGVLNKIQELQASGALAQLANASIK